MSLTSNPTQAIFFHYVSNFVKNSVKISNLSYNASFSPSFIDRKTVTRLNSNKKQINFILPRALKLTKNIFNLI